MSAPGLIEVRAPAEHSEGTRSQVLRWLKSCGERVDRDEPLLEVETDKVTVEIASPAAGVLREILKQADEEIAPGELLARIDQETKPQPHESRGDAPTDGAAADRKVGTAGPIDGARTTHLRQASGGTRLSPAVRRLLAENGIGAVDVHGTGRDGQVTVDDVLRHVADVQQAGATPIAPIAAVAHQRPAATPGQPGSQQHPGQDRQQHPDGGRQQHPEGGGQQHPEGGRQQHPEGGRRVPHSAMRKRIAEHMVRSLLHTAPHVTTVFEADFSAVLAHRSRHREDFARQGVPLTLTAYILAACVDAIRAVPESNARWTDDALELFDRIDIGVGTALPDRGLIVPVVRDVAALTLLEVARELGRLVGLAREDRLSPQDVRGGTFTLSNHGVSGSLLAAPIVINQPQTAILGVGKIEKRPVVIEEGGAERIVARSRAYLTLTIDHRVMDGHRANQFLEVLVRRLENWPPDEPQ